MGRLSLCTELCRIAYITLETEVVVRGFDRNLISDLCWLPRAADRTVDRMKGLPRVPKFDYETPACIERTFPELASSRTYFSGNGFLQEHGKLVFQCLVH